MKAKKNAGRVTTDTSVRRFGAQGAPLLRVTKGLRKAEKKRTVTLASGEEAIVKRHPDGTYDIVAESSTYWNVSDACYKRLLPAAAKMLPRQYPHQFVRMEQGGLPSLGKKRR
jgi:hypothetical protein